MKKYIIVIGENNPSVSREVQLSLFKAGFGWPCDHPHTISNTGATFLDLNVGGDGIITYSNDGFGVRSGIIAGAILLIPNNVIGKAHNLDGATKPVKKMTVKEVIAELGYEIEITK